MNMQPATGGKSEDGIFGAVAVIFFIIIIIVASIARRGGGGNIHGGRQKRTPVLWRC